MGLQVVLSNTSGVPIYEQIKHQVKDAILAGELAEDAMLPSIRSLARDLRVSVITTTRAYTDLAAEGFLTNVPGKGYFVLPRDSDLVHEQILREVEDHFSEALIRGRLAGLEPADFRNILNTLIASLEEEK